MSVEPFTVKKPVKEAYAMTTGLGLYNFFLNGEKVGKDEMTPGWTSYRRHLLYQTYEITDFLKEGDNVAGAMLAPGWYKGVMGLTKARTITEIRLDLPWNFESVMKMEVRSRS